MVSIHQGLHQWFPTWGHMDPQLFFSTQDERYEWDSAHRASIGTQVHSKPQMEQSIAEDDTQNQLGTTALDISN